MIGKIVKIYKKESTGFNMLGQESTLSFSKLTLDHGSPPENFGILPDYNSHAKIKGSCGDTMEF